MHVTGMSTFDARSLATDDGGVDIDTIRAYIASRMHLIPRYRQRLAYRAFDSHPTWVDDEHFNINYHVRHVALPKPGDVRQLQHLASRVMAQHLDRQKPLWEIWILEGLADPSHFVMISKVHHCMVDGVSSVDLLTVLLKPEPSSAFAVPPAWSPRPEPSSWEHAADVVLSVARLPFEVAQNLPHILSEVADPDSGVRASLNALRLTLGASLQAVSETPLNRRIGPHRRIDWLTMDLEAVKRIKQRLGGTVNDVVLATVAGALRTYLQRHDVDVATLDFRVMAPVSVRTEEQGGTLGNRISAWMVPMPLGEDAPRLRLEAIRCSTEHLKQSKQALSAEVLTQVGEWTPSTLLALGARLATLVLPFNLVVTNVPGPQFPLYLLGAKMIDSFGFLPLVDSLCLGIVLFSYSGKLCWGFTGECDLLPDLRDFVGDVETSFRELSDAAAAAAAADAPQVTPPSRVRQRRRRRS